MKKRGRKRTCYTYEEASQIVKMEGISSSKEYEKWWRLNRPCRMPKRPDRAYKNYKFKWSHFLGVVNKFPTKKIKFRSFEECKSYAKSLNLNNMTEWFKYCKSGNKPNDIPTRPDIVYRKKQEWLSWKDFLGYDVTDKVQKLIKAQRRIFYIIKFMDRPQNVYKFGITNTDIEKIKSSAILDNFKIIKLFYADDLQFDWSKKLSNNLSAYTYGENDEYIVPNIAQVISFFSTKYGEIMV